MKKLNGLLTFLAFLIVGIGFFLMFGSQSHRVVGQGNSCSVTGWAWGGIEEICSLSANPSSILIGESSTIVWHSQNATSGTLNPGNISLNPPSSGSMQVTPLETTFYTATFDSPEGPVNCEVVVIVTADNLSPPRNLTCTPVLEGVIDLTMVLDWDPPLEIPSYGFDYYVLFRYPPFHILQCFDFAGNPIPCPAILDNAFGLFETGDDPSYPPNDFTDRLDIQEGVTYYYAMVAVAVEQTGPNDIVIKNISDYSNTAHCTHNAPDPPDPCAPWEQCGDGDVDGPDGPGTGPGDGEDVGGPDGPGTGPGDGKSVACGVVLQCCATCADYGFSGSGTSAGDDPVPEPYDCTCEEGGGAMGGIRIDCLGEVPYFACDPCMDWSCSGK